MKALDMKVYRNSLTMKVLLGLLVAVCFLPRQAGAQVTDIHSFVGCVNSMASVGATVADAASVCIPAAGCYYTNTLSEESAQNACTLRDGTRLPRVIFSCPGPGGSQTLRFRPSFSLCTLGNDFTSSVINHIELGEDNRVVDHEVFQEMGDLALPATRSSFTPLNEFGAGGVVDTSKNNLGCNDCHDRSRKLSAFNLFRPIPPELADGTISTNDPKVVGPATPVPLSVICSEIANSTQLAKNQSRKTQAINLCQALLAKE